MFPILTAAAVVPSVQLPPEGAADAPVQQPLESAFVEAVERAFLRGASRQGARTEDPDEKGGPEAGTADSAAGAWAAGLNFQQLAPIAQEQGQAGVTAPLKAAGSAEGSAILLHTAGSTEGAAVFRYAAGGPAGSAVHMYAAGNPAGSAVAFHAAGDPADRQFGRSVAGTRAGARINTADSSAFPLNPAGGANPLSATVRPAVSGIPSSNLSVAAHSMRMATLQSSPLNAAAASGEAVMDTASDNAGAKGPAAVRAGSGVGTALAGAAPSNPAAAAKTALTGAPQAVSADTAVPANAGTPAEVGSASIPAQRPAPAGTLQGGPAAPGSVHGAAASGSLLEPGIVEPARPGIPAVRDADAAPQAVEAARTAYLAEPVSRQGAAATESGWPWREEADRLTNARPEVVESNKAIAQPEMIAAQKTSARPEAVAPDKANAQSEAISAQRTSAHPEAVSVRGTNVLPEAIAARKASALPDAAAQAANPRPDAAAAALPVADFEGMAAPSEEAGAARESVTAVQQSAARKGADAARTTGAQPLSGAAQAAGQYARVQAAARNENADKGQALKPEPDAERDLDAARSRPVGGRQQAAPGAILTVGEGPGLPPAEQAAAPAPAGGHQTASEPSQAAQLAGAALGALRRGETRFHLKLRPEGVGEVAVTISARDHDLRLTIRAGSESTRELILSQIGGLKQELTQGGYHLEGFSVDVSGGQSGQGGQAFAFRQDPGGQPGRQPDARPEPRGAPFPKETHLPRLPEARAGSINLRI